MDVCDHWVLITTYKPVDENAEEPSQVKGESKYRIEITLTDEDVHEVIDEIYDILDGDQVNEIVLRAAESITEYLFTDELEFHAQAVMEEAGLEL